MPEDEKEERQEKKYRNQNKHFFCATCLSRVFHEPELVFAIKKVVSDTDEARMGVNMCDISLNHCIIKLKKKNWPGGLDVDANPKMQVDWLSIVEFLCGNVDIISISQFNTSTIFIIQVNISEIFILYFFPLKVVKSLFSLGGLGLNGFFHWNISFVKPNENKLDQHQRSRKFSHNGIREALTRNLASFENKTYSSRRSSPS